jgi:hypothetical protein
MLKWMLTGGQKQSSKKLGIDPKKTKVFRLCNLLRTNQSIYFEIQHLRGVSAAAR